jgi:hypothetical protein
MKRNLLAMTALCIASAISPVAKAATVFDFQFDDSAGTNLVGAVDSSGNGNQFVRIRSTGDELDEYDGFATNGTGTLVLGPGFDSNGDGVLDAAFRSTRHVRLGSNNTITGNQKARLAVEFAPWDFSTAPTSGTSFFTFGFQAVGSTATTFNSFANFSLSHPSSDPGNIYLETEALGTGLFSSGSSQSALATFDSVVADPVTIFLDVDKLANEYSVSYSIGNGPETLFYNGTVSSARVGDLVRVSHTGARHDSTSNFFGVSSMKLTATAIPEPSSFFLLGAIGAGAIVIRRRRSARGIR